MSLETNLTAGTAKSSSAKQTTLTGGEISLKAEAPAMVLRETSGDTYVIYELTPTWKTRCIWNYEADRIRGRWFWNISRECKSSEKQRQNIRYLGKIRCILREKWESTDANISTSFTMTCTSGDVVYRSQTAAVSTEIKAASDQMKTG